MKKKHKIKFTNTYKWWDYSYLLQAMEDWCLYASKMHKTVGISLESDVKSDKLKVISLLCKRIREDNYEYCGVLVKERTCEYTSIPLGGGVEELKTINHNTSKEDWRKFVLSRGLYEKKQKQQDIDYLCLLFSKNLLTFWD